MWPTSLRIGRLLLVPYAAVALLAIAFHSFACAQTLVVGGKGFTEQLLIAEMTRQLLEAKGISVIAKTGFTTGGIRREQEAGLIDVYWEYTGTSLITFNNVHERLGPEETYARVAKLDGEQGLIWLTPSRVNNTYALAIREEDASARGITSISDLAELVRQGEQFRFASNTEFYLRPDGLGPLQGTYRFDFGPQNVVRMNTDAIYEALRSDTSIDVGLVFSTDGRVAAFEFILLEDDRQFFPSYLLTPVVRKATLDEYPELADYLNALSAKLDSGIMSALNGMVDIDDQPVEEVAASFLKDNDLI